MKEYSGENGIENLINLSIEKVKTMIETNNIIGEPICASDDLTIIPISKVFVGFVAGGGQYSDKSNRRVANHYPLAGGTGTGVSVSPTGFLIIEAGDVRYVDVENKSLYQSVLNLANKLVSKIKPDNQKQEGENEEN